MNARQFRPGLRHRLGSAHSFLIGSDRRIQVASSKIRIPFHQIGFDSTRGSGVAWNRGLISPLIDLLQHPHSAQDHHHPQEHAINIGLWPAMKEWTTRNVTFMV